MDRIASSPVCLALTSMLIVARLAAAQVTLSEIRIDQPGSDVDEYFEVAGPAGYGLQGLTYVVIGDGAGGSGVVEMALDLTGLTLPADGIAFVAESTFSLGPVPDLVASLNFENADNVTHLIVSGYEGGVGADLDENDDGLIDAAPWSEVIDCIAVLNSTASGELTYCEAVVGPDGSSAPAHVYIDAGWRIGPADPVTGVDTPGSSPRTLPVEIADFRGITDRGQLRLRWTLVDRAEISAFRVRRAESGIPVVTVPVAPERAGARHFDVAVAPISPGSHNFELMAVERDGSEWLAATARVFIAPTGGIRIDGPYPNPSRGATTLHLYARTYTRVTVRLWDSLGRDLGELYSGALAGGVNFEMHRDLHGNPPGLYFLVVTAGETIITRPVMILN